MHVLRSMPHWSICSNRNALRAGLDASSLLLLAIRGTAQLALGELARIDPEESGLHDHATFGIGPTNAVQCTGFGFNM
jgi:hypothetical protein